LFSFSLARATIAFMVFTVVTP